MQMPDNRQLEARRQGRNIQKRKPPISAGKAFALGLLASIIVAFIMSGALIMYSMVRDANTQAQQQQAAREQLEMFNESLSTARLTPPKESIDQAIASNANITVIRKETASDKAVAEALEEGTTDGANDDSAPGDVSNGGNGSSTGANESTDESTDADADNAQADDASSDDTDANGNAEKNANGESKQQADEDNLEDGDVIVNGAGVIMTSDGDILTNNHVVEGASSITVTINGRRYDAEITGTDPTSDLATIKCVDAKDLPVAKFGTSSELREGEWVMTVGNPYGLNDSVSTGSVSYLGRDIKMSANRVDIMYANMIQTNVPFNPGNSGGGLYNSDGEFVGIATMITTNDGSNSGVGYAIPGDYAHRIAEDLMRGEPASHAVMGLSLSDVPDDMVERYGLESNDGAMVTNITKSGPSEAACLALDDIIVTFDDEPVKDSDDLLFKVRALNVNDTVTIKVLRQGKEMTFDVRLGSDV